MAVRTPLINDSGNVKEMSSTQVDEIVDQVVYQYSLNPGITLSVVGSGGNLSSISDTRLQAGATSTSASAFPSEATTAEPSTVTVAYQRLNSASASLTPTADTGKTWPAYYTSGGHIQAMSLQDVKDTFLHPAIDLLTAGTTSTQQAGTYTIATSTSLAGATNVSATPIYADTRADTSAYSAGSIGETLDQPTTITNYYLHRIDGSDTSYTSPFFVNASNHLQEFDTTTFESLLQEWIRYTAASSTDGYAISYQLATSGSGNTRGTSIVDTRLNGSGNYQTRQVGADDYRAQEFPNGSPTTINTYNLRIIKS
tara:strand:- start:2801 stop:3736 length:936 start_codon:yes stop_codon:yes gene_type:complete